MILEFESSVAKMGNRYVIYIPSRMKPMAAKIHGKKVRVVATDSDREIMVLPRIKPLFINGLLAGFACVADGKEAVFVEYNIEEAELITKELKIVIERAASDSKDGTLTPLSFLFDLSLQIMATDNLKTAELIGRALWQYCNCIQLW